MKCLDLDPFDLRHDFSEYEVNGPESQNAVGVVEHGQADEENEVGRGHDELNKRYHGKETIHDD